MKDGLTLGSGLKAAFPPIDWSKSVLGRDVWDAWNQLRSVLMDLRCAQLSQVPACMAAVQEAELQMASAMRNRDSEGKT